MSRDGAPDGQVIVRIAHALERKRASARDGFVRGMTDHRRLA